jgi:GGDEF domain-containing protein
MYISPDKKVTNINEAFTDFIAALNMDPNSIKFIDDIFQEKDIQDLMDKVFDYNIFSSSLTITLDNQKFSVLVTAFASSLEEHSIKEITILFKDVTAMLKDREALIDRLYKDALTGLPNRQKLFYDLPQYEQSVYMMIIDIDGFSKINYLYGFQTGDIVLKQAAQILAGYQSDGSIYKLYKSDMDLFVVLIKKYDSDDPALVSNLAQKIRLDLDLIHW